MNDACPPEQGMSWLRNRERFCQEQEVEGWQQCDDEERTLLGSSPTCYCSEVGPAGGGKGVLRVLVSSYSKISQPSTAQRNTTCRTPVRHSTSYSSSPGTDFSSVILLRFRQPPCSREALACFW